MAHYHKGKLQVEGYKVHIVRFITKKPFCEGFLCELLANLPALRLMDFLSHTKDPLFFENSTKKNFHVFPGISVSISIICNRKIEFFTNFCRSRISKGMHRIRVNL